MAPRPLPPGPQMLLRSLLLLGGSALLVPVLLPAAEATAAAARGPWLRALALGPAWRYALNWDRTAPELRPLLKLSPDGRLRLAGGGPRLWDCELQLHVDIFSRRSPTVLTVALTVAAPPGWGCSGGQRRGGSAREPERIPDLAARTVLGASPGPASSSSSSSAPLCFPDPGGGGRGSDELQAALEALTSFPDCRCAQSFSAGAGGEDGSGGGCHSRPAFPLQPICLEPGATARLRLLCAPRPVRGPGAWQPGRPLLRRGPEILLELTLETSGTLPSGARRARRGASGSTSPQFQLPSYHVSVPENEPAGTPVIELRAQDPDEGEAGRLTYQMEALFDERSIGFFHIDSDTGAISNSRPLDRETKDTHVLKVTAVDHGSPQRSGATYLTVTVSDTNDHSPVFEQVEYRETVRENLEVGYEVLTIRATDGDAPSNANMRYRLLEGADGAFKIDPRTGVVRTRSVVDREEVAEYQLLVEANDQGLNPGPRSATATVRILVEDENDNYPQFSEKRYVVQVPEDVAVNTAILRVQATDQDQGQNAALHYSIVSGNLKGQFYLHSLSGGLDVINPLDYEAIREYTLRIKAQDGGRPPLINSSGLVNVQVLDVNDNAPIFVSSPFQAAVLENVPLGHSVLHIQAIDADSGENARLHYRLVDVAAGAGAAADHGLPARDGFPFQIHNSSGWITVCAELDREEAEHYSFGVEAVDHGSPAMSSSASVAITVLDVNDNDPAFTQPVYELRLNEDAAVGSSVLTLRARDRDANSVITYQLSSGNTRNRFALSSQSGGGLITLALPLDYKQERQYVLGVTASDGTRSHTAQVFINVTDANTHRPVFQSSHYTVSVREDKPVGSSIATISATDEDTGENARITYVLEDPVPQFGIHPDTGTLVTLMELDYEDQAAYTLAITARDNGIPQKSDTTSLEILIVDANDNAPRFLRDLYQGSVFEDAPPSTSVLQVSATDRDSGPNGRLLYTFQGGDDGDGDFYIEPTSGVIRTQRRLDRENVAVYSLRALAVDRGSPAPLSASVDVQVTVLDINDNPPVFEQDELELFVEENSPVGSVVARIRAADPDEGPNAQIMYQIVEGNVPEVFQLDLLSGDLRALAELDFERRRDYVLVVQATSAPLVSRATVHVRLLDQNDNPPVLPDFQVLFNNYVSNKSNSFPAGVIGRIPAHDPDLSDGLNYTFLRGNELNLLLLNPDTGELQLSRDLDNNRPLEALMEVSVSDGIHHVTALCTLRVTIITDDMLTNSITVRLENMSQEKFLSPLLSLFVEGVAAVLSTTTDGIFVFNIQNDTDVSSNILNVTFSALLPGGVRNKFFPSEDLQEQIYLNRTLLRLISTQRVLPFDDNICLREPCENYMKCVSVLKFDSSAPFISSTTVLFRPIHPISGLRCRCPPGFTGDYCETEIDLCYSNPCGSNGLCRSREGGYTCDCHEDYTGEHCEVNARSGRCAPGVCKNGGKCVNLLVGGFKCECLPGEFERPYCAVTTRSFPPQSFVTFKGLRQRFHFTLSLTFATRDRNALLLYNGRFNEKHDFLALEIIEEQLQLTFSAGETRTTVAPVVCGGVSDGQWHSVRVQYYNKPHIGRLGIPHGPSGEKVAVVSVDDCDTAVAVRFGGLLANYSCAAQGTQTGSKKSLDLTGPLLLGGVPNLPEDFPVHNRQFVGCMRNLSIDNQVIDMESFIANNGTRAGCTARENHCDSVWCQNGGTCVNKWNMYICNCPLRYGGKNCEQVMPHPQRFSGESLVFWGDLDITISVPWYLGLMFRTRKASGVLLAANAGTASKISLQILNSHVYFAVFHGSSEVASVRLGRSRVSDGEWHHLLVELKSAKDGKDIKYLAVVTLDYGLDQNTVQIGNQLPGLKMRSVLVGGLSEDQVTVQQGFSGCMQGVRMGETSTNILTLNMKEALTVRVKDGCAMDDPCASGPCPEHSYCTDTWDGYSCICAPGYFGRDCVDVCRLNPCEHVSACVRQPSSAHGYLCECGQSYYGQYCENKIHLPCPKGWWGSPVCGPCHCEVSKGFDPDCNKTNGECQCKENYYKPQNQAACSPCDCFAHGSHTRTCDMETGQCACKSGVIGRQCNRCDNPFAEVTTQGCEVIYSGCPRAFEAGIWWPQTKFGQPAAVPCPKGSVGNAIRHCSSEKGWLPPELFNCTTSSFVGLKVMNEKLHRNETRLDGDKSVQMARVLENATRSVELLYGNDVRTAYQLMLHLLQHESQQQGFDLAATRDVEFNENLVRTGSALLDPSHRDAWEQIQRTEGGTAHLLRHYEAYFSNLVKNMRRTYMKPFVIVTANMILAADVFDKANFSGARVPRFEDIYEDYPKELESSVLFPAHLFQPSDRRDAPTAKPSQPRGTPRAPPDGPAPHDPLAKRKRRHPDEWSRHAVGLVLIYRSLGQLLPEQYDPDRRSLRLPHRPVINSPIVSSLLHSEGDGAPGQPVLVEYTLLETEDRTKPVCVFWNHSLGSLGAGGWSAKGCELVSRNSSHITCQCSHASGLAVLMDISKREHGEVLPLKIATYAGVAVSLAALLAALVLLLALRTLRANLHSIHRNLIAALFSSQLVFVTGIDQTETPFTCTVIAILLHYFYLSTFAWLFVEDLHIYRMLTEVRNIDAGHMRFYYVLGWGIPAIVTGLAVGLDPQGYGNPDFCWLSIHDTLIWSFAGPIGVVVIINTVIFVLSARVSCRRKHRAYDRTGIISGLRTAFLLLLLISATWLLGLMAVNSDVMAFHYLFAVFSCLQGVAIFLFHCVFNKEVQKHLKATLMGKKAHPDDSTTTRATLLTRSLNCNNTYIEEPNMYRTALGESTASLDSTIREEGTKKLSVSSGQARGRPDSDAHLFRRRNSKNPRGNDSDSDSELSLEEHSSSYASSHSSDSEEDGVDEKSKWNPGSCKANDRGPIHSTPKDPLSNHIKATWPPDSMTGSDGEDARCKPKLKVETKVNVELHQENQENQDDGRDAPSDKENPGLPRDNQMTPHTNHQHPEQRKGILKNKVTYPPPLTERNLKNRFREKLADYNQTMNSSRTSSLGSNDGICPTVDPGVTVKNSPREHSCDQLNGVVMNVRTGTVHADASDSEGSNETSI
ncbi:cadherin EGF LAG seven-pass G-type receptor 1 isoform X2 [Monodelphis domestica]|uniref:cadherin EGF LAG seven-pass G-type receptor 1 isoform X2 n=1 Tax=Monodelphis domestica TaxID=13616 RepID=UPI0024E1D649|nr:cadherin EGF LAG seven-pass G-type receptor 1 isoform X2 [Monodelphis domestica]